MACLGAAGTVATLVLAAVVSGCGGPAEAPTTKSRLVGDDLPASPVTDRVVACMKHAGWTVTRSITGGIESEEMPQQQMSAYQAAYSVCAKSSGWDDMNDLNPEQVDELYRQELKEHNCLQRLNIESDPPPSLQKYRDSYGSAEQYLAMMPGVMDLSQGQMNIVVRKCPPPNWFMNLAGK